MNFHSLAFWHEHPLHEERGAPRIRPFASIAPLAVGVGLALLPAPAGLSPFAWYYLALFVAVIVGLILEPAPAAAVGFVGVTTAAVLSRFVLFSPAQLANPAFKPNAAAINWALFGFSNPTVWLIFCAFVFSLGYEKTGLGKRISLLLLSRLAAERPVLAPDRRLSDVDGAGLDLRNQFDVPHGARAQSSGAGTRRQDRACHDPLDDVVPRLPAGGSDPAGDRAGARYWLYPPEIKKSPEVPEWAKKELAELGSLSRQEAVLLLLVLLALALWIFGANIMDPTTAALLVVGLLVITRTIKWIDVLADKPAFNTLIWFGTLVPLAGGLAHRPGARGGANDRRFCRADRGVLPASLPLRQRHGPCDGAAAGDADGRHTDSRAAYRQGGACALPEPGHYGRDLAYGTGPSPVYAGSGFLPGRDFWRLGAIFGLYYLLVFLGVGLPTLFFL